MSDCCTTCLDAQFGARTARQQLSAYRRGGAAKETRQLVDMLVEADVAGARVLDIGAGIGAAHGALLERGASTAVSVDASRAFEQVAQELASERGYRDRVAYRYGDFAAIAKDIDAADVVVLDKVICCYPDVEALVDRSAERARRLCGLVYPRDGIGHRALDRLANGLRRLFRKPFRTYIHAPAVVAGRLAAHGFELRSSARTMVWRVEVYERSGQPRPSPAPAVI